MGIRALGNNRVRYAAKWMLSGGGASGQSPNPINATGGTKSTPGDGYVYHSFTSSGSFVVSNSPGASIDYLLVGGGGGGGFDRGGGGGAGAFRPGAVSTVIGTHPVTIGQGGAGGEPGSDPVNGGANGGDTVFVYNSTTITANGGGGGGASSNLPTSPLPWAPGPPTSAIYTGNGSGGGAPGASSGAGIANQGGIYGNPGKLTVDDSPGDSGGGGGGAGSGASPTLVNPYPYVHSGTALGPDDALNASDGATLPWIPTSFGASGYFAGGGAGGGGNKSGTGSDTPVTQKAGAGKGGSPTVSATAGDNYTGSGGGGGAGGGYPTGKAGGHGRILLRYPAPGVDPGSATGGTIVISPTYKTHYFTSPGSFVVSGSLTIDYIVVGGGGSGGGADPAVNPTVIASGGGGGGGVVSSFPEGPGGPSPTSDSSVILCEGTYAITVGEGGTGGPTSSPGTYGEPGHPSSIATVVSARAEGGAEGGTWDNPAGGSPGASGGGGGYSESATTSQSAGEGNRRVPIGNTAYDPVSRYAVPTQGYDGGIGILGAAGGGGGAGGVGSGCPSPDPTNSVAPVNGGQGGVGKGFANIPPSYGTDGPDLSLRYFAGGGGGGAETGRSPSVGGAGGAGGGGRGSTRADAPGRPDYPGIVNTGGGGGGGDNGPPSPEAQTVGSGAKGIVIIRYSV